MQSSSQIWKDLFASGAALEARAVIAGTVYADISAPVVTRALMQDSLSVGNVVSASLALAVRGAGSIPRSAAVVIETRLNDGQAASEWLPQGTFYISRRMRNPVTGLLALECYDALLKANAVWTPSAGAWPRTLAAVTAELAALLGVALDGRTVIPTGASYAMSEPAEGTTIRDALGIVAQAAGGNWVMTPRDRLRLVRVGESGDAVDVVGVVGGIDVGAADTVTGVRSTVDSVVTLTGDDTGIVVDVTVAPAIAAELAETLIGQRWQPFRLSGAIYDPAAELGDGVRTGAGGEVASALCSEQAAFGPAFRGDIAAPDPGEVTDEYPYIGSAEKAVALAKAAVAEAVDRLDDSLTQQEIFNRLTDDGAVQGLVLYNGQLYVNASYIQSGTLTLGGLTNQNGTLRVLDASGNEIGKITNDGIVTSAIYGNDTISMRLYSGVILMTDGSTEMGRIWAARMADSSGATLFINGASSTGVNQRSGLSLWPDGGVDLASGDGTAALTLSESGDVIIIADGDASIVADGNIGIRSGGMIVIDGNVSFGNPAAVRTNIGAKATQSAVSDPAASGTAVAFIDSISQNGQGVITPTKKTVQSATQSAAGLMSAADKKKLDGIAAGAQVNSVTGVKGNAESSYRTGNINLTPANIGAVAKSGDTMTGTLMLSKRQDASGTADNAPALIVGGNRSESHLEFDDNEIIAKANGTSGATLYLNNDGGGAVQIGGGGLVMLGHIKGNSTAALGTADNPFHQLVLGGATNATMTADSTNPRITFQQDTGTQPVHLIYTDFDSYRGPAGLKVIGGTGATPAWFEVEGQVYAARFNGPLTGNVTGNCSGSAGSVAASGITGTLGIGHGGTGATTAAAARTNLKTPYAAQGTELASFSAIPVEDGLYAVYYSGADTDAPVKTSASGWRWHVIQIGQSNRLTQIAFSPSRNRERMYVRQKYDSTWYGWYQFQGTAV